MSVDRQPHTAFLSGDTDYVGGALYSSFVNLGHRAIYDLTGE